MARRSEDPAEGRPLLLVGAGPRAREVGLVLSALGTARNGEGEAPQRPHGLEDLEELLARGPGAGTLLLEYGRVPAEDIGFVRRFLERHAGWRLVVVGDDPAHSTARALLGLPRAQWLPWPPDLEQLAALLGGPPGPTGGARPAPAAPAPRGAPARPGPARGATAAAEALDLAALVEELLAGEALAGKESPRYQFQAAGEVPVDAARAPLARALNGLLGLARAAAGPEGTVEVSVERLADPPGAGLLRVDFPAGVFGEEDVADLLERADLGATDEADPLGRALAAAAQAAARLRDLGGEPSLSALEGDRRSLTVLFRGPARGPQSTGSGRGGERDPFA